MKAGAFPLDSPDGAVVPSTCMGRKTWRQFSLECNSRAFSGFFTSPPIGQRAGYCDGRVRRFVCLFASISPELLSKFKRSLNRVDFSAFLRYA